MNKERLTGILKDLKSATELLKTVMDDIILIEDNLEELVDDGSLCRDTFHYTETIEPEPMTAEAEERSVLQYMQQFCLYDTVLDKNRNKKYIIIDIDYDADPLTIQCVYAVDNVFRTDAEYIRLEFCGNEVYNLTLVRS